jgi:hypothetical protein
MPCTLLPAISDSPSSIAVSNYYRSSTLEMGYSQTKQFRNYQTHQRQTDSDSAPYCPGTERLPDKQLHEKQVLDFQEEATFPVERPSGPLRKVLLYFMMENVSDITLT